MTEVNAPRAINCIENALEIPVVQSMKNNVGNLYTSVKSKNRISTFALNSMESGVTLVYRSFNSLGAPLQKPVSLVDSVVCVVLDEVKGKYPAILEPTETVIEASKAAILRTNVAQKTLNGFDTVLGAAEALITMVPSVTVNEDDICEKDRTLIIRALTPITACYNLATWPLRYTASFLHERRTRIRTLSRSLHSDDESDQEVELRQVVSTETQLDSVGVVECIFFIPRFLLRTIGKLASERSERLFAAENMIADCSPNKPEVRTDEKKRKFDCMDTDEFDDEASLNDLNETLGDGTESDDKEYVPSESSVDSLEYNSGSVVDDGDKLTQTSVNGEHIAGAESHSFTLSSENEYEDSKGDED